jgi:hypothetical protein
VNIKYFTRPFSLSPKKTHSRKRLIDVKTISIFIYYYLMDYKLNSKGDSATTNLKQIDKQNTN